MAWSDYSDWTSESTIKLTSLFDGITPVIKAINERNVASGISPISEISRLDEISYLTGIQNRVSWLITLFVNHLDSGGVWTGQAEIPNWTESDILTAIGDPSRIPAPTKLDELSSEWLYQQYEILNLLLWTQDNSTAFVNGSGFDGTSGLGLYTIVEAVDLAIANILPAFHDIGNYTQAGKVLNKISGSATAGKGSINFSSLHGDIFKSAGDVYFFAGNDIGTYPYLRIFDGAGVAIDGLNYITAISADNRSSYITPIIGSDSIFPTYPPGPLDNTWRSSIGWHVLNSYFVSKFNVTGGFEYV